jgi:SAM-dependent methyltransferase
MRHGQLLSAPFQKERAAPAGASIDRLLRLAQARIGVPCRLHWIHTEADRTGLGDAQFDLTFCVDVVHHLNNGIGVFEEAHRMLKPGGALCPGTDSENIIRSREPLSIYWPQTVEPNWHASPVSTEIPALA